MTTRQANIVCALWSLDGTGILVNLYKEDELGKQTIDRALKAYRKDQQWHDSLVDNLKDCIEWQNRKNGRATVRRSRTVSVNESESQREYREAKHYCTTNIAIFGEFRWNRKHLPAESLWRHDHAENITEYKRIIKN